MAITAKLLSWLLEGGRGTDEAILLAEAMDQLSDASIIFQAHNSHLTDGLSPDESCTILCELAQDILDRRAARAPFKRDPFEPVFYVYHHYSRKTGEVFYVGKGKGDRYKTKKSRTERWACRVAEEEGYIATIVKGGMTEAEALDFERQEIERLRDVCRLENVVGVFY